MPHAYCTPDGVDNQPAGFDFVDHFFWGQFFYDRCALLIVAHPPAPSRMAERGEKPQVGGTGVSPLPCEQGRGGGIPVKVLLS